MVKFEGQTCDQCVKKEVCMLRDNVEGMLCHFEEISLMYEKDVKYKMDAFDSITFNMHCNHFYGISAMNRDKGYLDGPFQIKNLKVTCDEGPYSTEEVSNSAKEFVTNKYGQTIEVYKKE